MRSYTLTVPSEWRICTISAWVLVTSKQSVCPKIGSFKPPTDRRSWSSFISCCEAWMWQSLSHLPVRSSSLCCSVILVFPIWTQSFSRLSSPSSSSLFTVITRRLCWLPDSTSLVEERCCFLDFTKAWWIVVSEVVGTGSGEDGFLCLNTVNRLMLAFFFKISPLVFWSS